MFKNIDQVHYIVPPLVDCVSSRRANGNRSSILEKQISSYQLRRQKSHAPDVIAQTTNIVASSQLLSKFPQKFGDSYPLNENDLNESVTDFDYKEVNTGEVESEVQLLTADLIREGLKLSTSMKQHFITRDPDIERALKSLRNLE
ncbi:hypothetical protein TNCV_4659821 [Trichonephila clavipes]|uniref:Uncharacterized protein n=1 Tax=Trichonephila clavipes TaxID=2585209 RepID=A0A8X6S8G2_TRICX|nr:hypothetical protein TNCV_4659821 [Trichonephila clavipes]